MFSVCQSPDMVEMRRIELLTPCLQGRCSPSWATPPFRVLIFRRLCVLRDCRVCLYAIERIHIGYGKLVGLSGLEPPTSRLSGVRSNHLSYAPMLSDRQCHMFFFLNPSASFEAAGGDEEDRTPDPLRARQVLSQLSYTPMGRFEAFQPLTPLSSLLKGPQN